MSPTTTKIDGNKVDPEFCVVIKPPPPTPAPTLGPGTMVAVEAKVTNSSTNYTLEVVKSKCLFWNTVNQTWGSNGCVVSSLIFIIPKMLKSIPKDVKIYAQKVLSSIFSGGESLFPKIMKA